jgi:hypothetical protein
MRLMNVVHVTVKVQRRPVVFAAAPANHRRTFRKALRPNQFHSREAGVTQDSGKVLGERPRLTRRAWNPYQIKQCFFKAVFVHKSWEIFNHSIHLFCLLGAWVVEE